MTKRYSDVDQQMIARVLGRLHHDGLGFCFGEFASFQRIGNHHKRDFIGNVEFWSKAPVNHILNVLKKMGFEVTAIDHQRVREGLDIKATYTTYTAKEILSGREFELRVFSPCSAKTPWECIKDLDVNKMWWDNKLRNYVPAPGVDVNKQSDQIRSGRLECDYETPADKIENAVALYEIGLGNILVRSWLDKDEEKTHTTDTKEQKEQRTKEPIMTEQNTAISFAKECFHDGMWRSVGDNTVSHAKDVICNVLRNKGADDGTMKFVGDLLDSKEGEAAVAGFLAVLLHFGPQYIPMIPEAIKGDPRVARLAKEYGTKATAEGMTLVYKELLAIAMPVFAQLAKDLQTLPPVRIETEIEEEVVEETVPKHGRKTA